MREARFQSKEELEDLLQGKTPERLARELGVCHLTVYRAMHRLNIPTKKHYSGFSSRGEKHWNWKGGRRLTQDGYVLIYTGLDACELEHHLIMEKILGRELRPGESIHHINGIKTDNKEENLMLVAKATHYGGKTTCPFCERVFITT